MGARQAGAELHATKGQAVKLQPTFFLGTRQYIFIFLALTYSLPAEVMVLTVIKFNYAMNQNTETFASYIP